MLSAAQLLVAFRAACAPALFVLACYRFNGIVLAGVVGAALVSDVVEGFVARRTRTVTATLRYADTIVGTIFFIAAAVSLRVAVPDAYDGLWLPLVSLIVVHVSRATVVSLVSAFLTGRPTPLLGIGLWLGVANELEGFLASLLLREWRCDVPTVVHAFRYR
jgi:hypothetical protein